MKLGIHSFYRRIFCVSFETASNLLPPHPIFISYSIIFTFKNALHHRQVYHHNSFCDVCTCTLTYQRFPEKKFKIHNPTIQIDSAVHVITYLNQIQVLFEKNCQSVDGYIDIFIMFCYDLNELSSVGIMVNFFSKLGVIIKRLGNSIQTYRKY